jgi:hypothetical protein
MDDKALAYVSQVKDHQQFPAARVAYGARVDGETIYMYQRSSSSTAESMNAANKLVRDWTAVDPINALILLLKLEAKRYADNKEQAWQWTEVLTPHGQKLCNNAFKSINPRDYTISIESKENRYDCTVSSNRTNNTYYCWFPRTYDDDNSLFGGCSCGVPNTDGIPCNHMCVVVKSYRIEGLNETNIMPIWWHTSHWRRQYPADSVVRSTVDIESLRNAAASTKSNHMEFKLCPPYSAQRKSGRPREEKRIKGAIEIAIDKTEKKKKMVETRKKREPIEPDDLVEYRNIKKKRKKDNKTMGEAMGKTVVKGAKGKEKAGKGKATKGKGGKQKSGYKKRVTQSTTTSPKTKKARRGK